MKTVNDTVSQAAQDFIKNAKLLALRDLSEIGRLRSEEHELALVENKKIIGSLIEAPEIKDYAGVKTMVVTPKNYKANNDDFCILYFFGGGFVVGSPDVDMSIIAGLASRTGIKVIAPYYRLSPECDCPAAIEDGIAVYTSVLESIAAANIVVVGESAGGNLSLAVILRARELGMKLPAAAVLMSPWCDLTPASESKKHPPGFDPTLDYELHSKLSIAAYSGQYDLKNPMVSPLYADYKLGFPSTFITSGTRDLLVGDCQRLESNLKAAGVDVQLNIWQGMWHVFEWYPEIPEAQQSLDRIAHFISINLT